MSLCWFPSINLSFFQLQKHGATEELHADLLSFVAEYTTLNMSKTVYTHKKLADAYPKLVQALLDCCYVSYLCSAFLVAISCYASYKAWVARAPSPLEALLLQPSPGNPPFVFGSRFARKHVLRGGSDGKTL